MQTELYYTTLYIYAVYILCIHYVCIHAHTLLQYTILIHTSLTHIHLYTLYIIGTFKKMILFSPCIKPYFPSYLEYSIIAAHYAGFGLTLATKFDTDITKDKLTHSIEQIAFWSSLRNYFPTNLIVTGPTFQWLYELLVASTYVHQVSV